MNPISLQGRYRTRDGLPVRILCIDAPGEQSVVGLVGDCTERWGSNGQYWTGTFGESPFDLIEVTAPPPTPLEAAARDIKERLEYFAAEGVRPDEWLLKEWAAKLAAALEGT